MTMRVHNISIDIHKLKPYGVQLWIPVDLDAVQGCAVHIHYHAIEGRIADHYASDDISFA